MSMLNNCLKTCFSHSTPDDFEQELLNRQSSVNHGTKDYEVGL